MRRSFGLSNCARLRELGRIPGTRTNRISRRPGLRVRSPGRLTNLCQLRALCLPSHNSTASFKTQAPARQLHTAVRAPAARPGPDRLRTARSTRENPSPPGRTRSGATRAPRSPSRQRRTTTKVVEELELKRRRGASRPSLPNVSRFCCTARLLTRGAS